MYRKILPGFETTHIQMLHRASSSANLPRIPHCIATGYQTRWTFIALADVAAPGH
jgi:hypothetical protein